jgi:cytochrome P450
MSFSSFFARLQDYNSTTYNSAYIDCLPHYYQEQHVVTTMSAPTAKSNAVTNTPFTNTIHGLESSTLVFSLVMALASTSIYSAALQLEKVFFDGFENDKFIYKVPYISSLKVPESFAFCTLTLVILGLYIKRQIILIQRADLNMPMVPSYIPFLGNALQFLTSTPWDLMESWHRTYGPIYAFKLLGKTVVSIEKPEFLKEVLQSKIQNVKKDSHFSYKPFLPILGKGIVTSEGKEWMYQRRKISTALKVDVLELIPAATLSAVQRLMQKMDKSAETKQTIDIAEELRHLTLQVISECFLSLEAEESDNTFATMYLPIVEEGNLRVWRPDRSYMFFMPFFWRHIFGIRRLNNYVSKLIVDRWNLRKAEKKCNTKVVRKMDILDKVLAHFENEHPGKELDSKWISQLRDEFKTFMLAGHETSAAMMTWTFFELMKNGNITEEVSL